MNEIEESTRMDVIADVPKLEKQIETLVKPFLKKHHMRHDQLQIIYSEDGCQVFVRWGE